MVLVDWQIRERIAAGNIKVEPFLDSAINPNSLDIRLGKQFVWYEESKLPIDPYDKDTVTVGISEITGTEFLVAPYEFILAETLERIKLPDNIVATIEGKSSLARLGIQIHATGGWIDAGFSGTITLEMSNLNRRAVKIYAGMPVAQLVFYETEHAELPYNKRIGAKYIDQSGATISRYYQNIRDKGS